MNDIFNDNVASLYRLLQVSSSDGVSPERPSPAELEKLAKLKALKAYLADLYNKLHILQWQFFAQYIAMFFFSAFLLVYLRHNKQVALLGDPMAARKILLPAYTPLLKFIALISLSWVIYFAFILGFDVYPKSYGNGVGEVFALGRNIIALVTIIFMYQKSVSVPALIRAMIISVVLSVAPIPILFFMESRDDVSRDDRRTFVYVVRGLLLLMYTYIFLRPPHRASNRSLREYCIFSILYLSFVYIYQELFRAKKNSQALNTVIAASIWNSFSPFFIWRVLRADTEHWRGMGRRAVSLQSKLRQMKCMDEITSSEGLHLMIEMHRKYILDFAYLELISEIGKGATATVFKGILKSKTKVAVKVYTPPMLTDEIVAEFSNEAALCAALQHPNIVKFYGLCISPPNISLVSELCCGNLSEVLEATPRNSPGRLQQNINLCYMLDAARSIAHLHSFTPAFIHRDIKPDNFLIDTNGTIKLTDFGESRVLPHLKRSVSRSVSHSIVDIQSQDHYENNESNDQLNCETPRSSFRSLNNINRKQCSKCMTVKGTIDFMAPEVMKATAGKASYAEKADIYSLGVTMWQILHPGKEKYPTIGSHLKVYELVQDGQRPSFNEDINSRLRAMIENAWNPDPQLRPSARNIVHFLEELQEEINAPFASQLSMELPLQNRTWKHKTYSNIISGYDTILHLIEHQYVDSRSEALRLCNALMDSSLIHHTRHTRPFEHSNAMYFFSDDKIEACLPLEQARDSYIQNSKITHDNDNSDTMDKQSKIFSSKLSECDTVLTSSTDIYTSYSDGTKACRCSKLARGYDRPKLKKNKKFRHSKVKLNDNYLTSKLIPDKNLLSTSKSKDIDINEFDEF